MIGSRTATRSTDVNLPSPRAGAPTKFDLFGAKPAPDAESKGLFGAKRGASTRPASAPACELHELGAQLTVRFVRAQHAGGHRLAFGLLHASHLDAEVARLYHHRHPTRLDQLLDRLCDLTGHPLLHLEAVGERVHDARQLGQAEDTARRHVADVTAAEHRQQVVLELAEGGQGHVLGRGHRAAQELDVAVQMPVIDGIDEVAAQRRVHLFEVDDHAGLRIHGSTDGDLDHVVVPVISRASAEYLAIALLAPLRTAQDVRRREGGTPLDPYGFRHSTPLYKNAYWVR